MTTHQFRPAAAHRRTVALPASARTVSHSTDVGRCWTALDSADRSSRSSPGRSRLCFPNMGASGVVPTGDHTHPRGRWGTVGVGVSVDEPAV